MSNSIIYCIIDIFAKPESVEKVRDVLIEILEYSLNDDGCLYYKLFENINDKFQFTFIEIWANEDAFEKHLQSDHVRQASFDINGKVLRPPDIKRYKPIQSDSNKMNNRRNSRLCILI